MKIQTADKKRCPVLRSQEKPTMVYHTVFVQLAHTDRTPRTLEPAFRVLRAVRNEKSAARAQELLTERLKGDGGEVIPVRHGQELLLHKGDEQTDEAKTAKIAEVMAEARDMKRRKQEAYDTNYELKIEDKQKEAQARYDKYIDQWNEYPWVKLMKSVHGIKETTRLRPGTSAMAAPEMEVPDLDLEAVNDVPIPPGVMSTEQNYVVLSIAYDNKSERMEPVVLIHDVCATVEEASARARHPAVVAVASPMSVKVLKVGKWIFPYEMAWRDDPQKIEYKDSPFLTQMQQDKKDNRVKYKERVEELKQRQRIDDSRAAQMAETLGMRADEIHTVTDSQEGANAIAEALSISSKACREDAVDAIREKFLGQTVEDKIDPW